jgi:hypothetical protein
LRGRFLRQDLLWTFNVSCQDLTPRQFSSAILQRSEKALVGKYLARRPLEELRVLAAKRSGVEAELISSRSRQKKYSQARSLLAWLAVEEEGYPSAVVAQFLGISRVGVKKALERWPQSDRK